MSTYPIAEHFGSIQGEGQWTGTPMFFIRLAGCNVGKWTNPVTMQLEALRILNPKHSICTTSDGQDFLCDTDYSKSESLTVEQLLELVGTYEHVCITGGEPFLHNLGALIEALEKANKFIHIETSGTMPIEWEQLSADVWITCCPKEGFLLELLEDSRVAEWKFLVGPGFNEEALRRFQHADKLGRAIFIQPVGEIDKHLRENLDRCLELLKRNPSWRLSAQLHKWLEVR